MNNRSDGRREAPAPRPPGESGRVVPSGHAAASAPASNADILEDERDEYDELLASPGRTFDQDCRIAIHESGHIIAARLLGNPLGGATVDPGPGYEGRVWGECHVGGSREVAAMPPMFGRRSLL
ncbi:hypothetical protein ACVI1J_001390 [Bradyrhizobium diazoefficiens]